jgi:multiple sugar transport system substrate-binding protein
MRRIQWLIPLVLILLAAMILSGCGSPVPTAVPEQVEAPTPAPTDAPQAVQPTQAPMVEPVEIEFWNDWAPEGAQGLVLQALLDEFNASQDQVLVTSVYVGGQQSEKVAAALASGAPPDVCWISGAGGNYYEEDMLLPMDRVYSEALDRNDFIPGLIETNQYLGKDISIPFENSNLAVYYNKDMLDEKGAEYPPAEVGAWTWSDFVDMAKLFSDPEQGKFGYDPRWAGAMLYSMIWEGGSQMLSPDLKTNLICSDAATRDITIKGLQRLHDFVWVSKITANDVGDMGFGSGDMAFSITGPWDMPRYLESSPDLNIGVAPFPADEDTSAAISYWYQKALAVFKTDAEHEDATLKFLKWFYSPEIQARWCAEAGYLPITQSAAEHKIWKAYAAEHPYVQVFMDQAATMRRRPMDMPQGDFGTMIDSVRLDEATPEEAVDTYCQTAQQILDEFWSQPHR